MSQHAPQAAADAGQRTAERSWLQLPPVSWVIGFAMFWYRFIVGDDWTLAASAGIGLAVTALLHARGVDVWWLVPAMVIVIIGLDLGRASRRHG